MARLLSEQDTEGRLFEVQVAATVKFDDCQVKIIELDPTGLPFVNLERCACAIYCPIHADLRSESCGFQSHEDVIPHTGIEVHAMCDNLPLLADKTPLAS